MAAQARHQQSAAVQRVAAAALWNLTAGHNDNKLRCGEEGARLLVGALGTHVRDAAVVETVLGALATVLPGVVASLAGVWGWEGAGAVVGEDEGIVNGRSTRRATASNKSITSSSEGKVIKVTQAQGNTPKRGGVVAGKGSSIGSTSGVQGNSGSKLRNVRDQLAQMGTDITTKLILPGMDMLLGVDEG